MARNRKDDSLPLDALMRHHRAAWRVERVGWALMALALLGALLGLFGDGPMSQTSAGNSAAFEVSYDRFQRSSAPQVYSFAVHPSVVAEGSLYLRFDASLIEGIELDSVVPEPDSVRAASRYTDFVFRVEPGQGPLRITFRFRPATFGHLTGYVTAPGAPPVEINQFIYP